MKASKIIKVGDYLLCIENNVLSNNEIKSSFLHKKGEYYKVKYVGFIDTYGYDYEYVSIYDEETYMNYSYDFDGDSHVNRIENIFDIKSIERKIKLERLNERSF